MDFTNTVRYEGRYPARLDAQNGTSLDYSAPIEYGGLKGTMTPEDAFVGSANMCFQIVFKSVSEGLGMRLSTYACTATGDVQTVDGSKRFVKITLRPEMRFVEGSKLENLQKALDGTKKRCLVANSMSCEVVVEPKVL
jgi:organic hydroperoxide reductase OsmC/OhrA